MITEFQNEYRWLSCMVDVPIVYKGLKYKSVEHAYHSAKSDNPKWKEFCQITASPYTVKQKADKLDALEKVEGWDLKKIDVMRECLITKFNQEPFKSKLIDTKYEYIQEGNNWGDDFWGFDFKKNSGLNHLGMLIMEIRLELILKQ